MRLVARAGTRTRSRDAGHAVTIIHNHLSEEFVFICFFFFGPFFSPLHTNFVGKKQPILVRRSLFKFSVLLKNRR
jgi:hypothetical protein